MRSDLPRDDSPALAESESRRVTHALPDRLKPRLGSQSQAREESAARDVDCPPLKPITSVQEAAKNNNTAGTEEARPVKPDEAPAQATRAVPTVMTTPAAAAEAEPTLTNMAATSMLPPTAEEVEEEFALLLEQLQQLRYIQHRGRYVAQREVQNMRRAYDFALTREKELFAEIHGGTADGRSYVPSVLSKEADVELVELEKYVATPLSDTYENQAKGFSWESVLHTPGERRMQSVVLYLLLFFTGIPNSTLLIAFLIYIHPITAALAIIYLILIFTKWSPVFPVRKNIKVARSRVFYWYRDYFPVRLVVPIPTRARFDAAKNYLFVYHPHGIHSFGAIICFGLDINDTSKLLPGIRTHLQTLRINFFIPFWRQLMLWMGAGDASAACIRSTLRAGPGESVLLVVGGAAESLKSRPNTNELVLKERKGFIKIALQEGSPLVPVYGFGENNVYGAPAIAQNAIVKKALSLFKNITGFALPLVSGRGFFFFKVGIMPYRRPIVVVVGDPVEVPKIAEPTDEDIAEWHDKYVAALERLYTTHCDVYDLESTGLRIS